MNGRRAGAYPVTAFLIAANVVVFILMEILSGSTEDSRILVRWGAAHLTRIRIGEYWRLFTCMFIHAGIRHLLNNMVVLAVMGSQLEMIIGHIRYLILYLAGGLAASFISYVYYLNIGRSTVFMGASGAVFAVIGGMVFAALRNRGRANGISLQRLIIMIALSLYLGFTSPGVSNVAHISGLFAGFILCALLSIGSAPTSGSGGPKKKPRFSFDAD